MRIALLTSQWPGVRLGGIGVYTVACARGLALAGHEVHVFAPVIPKDAGRSFPSGVFLHEVALDAWGENRTLPNAMAISGDLIYRMNLSESFAAQIFCTHSLKFCPKCEKIRFDIVEGPEYEGIGQGFESNDIDEHPPYVTQLHSGSAIAREVGNVPNDSEQALREAMELHAIAVSDGICAPSQAVIDDTRRAYGMESLATDAEVIPLPMDLPEIEFSLPEDQAPVLYVGRLELLKGAHLLAPAAAQFLQRFPEARLRILGPDTATAPDADGKSSGKSMIEWMKNQIGPHLAQRVTFLGERTRTEIFAELQGCAFLVCPSLRESYSYVCCEALAAGRPVVVSRSIGATEVVADAGITFERGNPADLAQAMERLWSDRDLREKLSQTAWQRARTALSTEAAIERRIQFYQKIIARRKFTGNQASTRRVEALPKVQRARMSLLRSLCDDQPQKIEPLLDILVKDAELQGDMITPGMRLVQRLQAHVPGPARFRLYGAGRHTAKLLMEKSRWEAAGHTLVGLIDDHPRFQEEPRCYGLPVISCAAAATELGAADVVILSTDAFEEQFWNNTEPLRARGIPVYRLYT